MSKLHLALEALDVTTFEVESKPKSEPGKEVTTAETRMAMCTQCTKCNWTV